MAVPTAVTERRGESGPPDGDAGGGPMAGMLKAGATGAADGREAGASLQAGATAEATGAANRVRSA